MRALIRMLRALLAVLLIAAATPVYAASLVDTAKLDQLFAELKLAPSADAAETISRQIWAIWMVPSDEKLAARMATAGAFMTMGDLRATMAVLDKIVADYPDYSEGWNQRATVEYMMNNFSASLADIDKTLALEPRHYGALAGRVMIYLQQGHRAEALHDMITALAIHPYLSTKQLFPELAPPVTHI